jgi:hypothetical protein
MFLDWDSVKSLMNMMIYIQRNNAFAVLQQLVEVRFLHLFTRTELLVTQLHP